LLALLVMNCGALGWGQSSTANLLASPSSDWANRGHWTLGAQVGFALENAIPRNVSHVNLLIAQPQLGFIVHDFKGPRFPVRRFEAIGEGIFGNAVHPGGRVTGAGLVLRFDGKNHGRIVPFFDIATGVQRTTLYNHIREVNGATQFSPQGGPGIQYFFSPQRALVIQYRYYHMSNAGLQEPNHGFNANMLTVGFRWLRRPRPLGARAASQHSHNPIHYLFGAD
jgi:lipid A 3-O-deacylase PagL